MSGDWMVVCTSVSVVNANRNDGRWNVNVNRLDNDNRWNVGNRFFFRNYAFSPKDFPEGFLFSKNSFHPKSIFPLSTSIFEILIYFLSSIILHSHIIEIKNFAKSFWLMASDSKLSFLVPTAYLALKTKSKVSNNNLSTFTPIVCLCCLEI